MKISVVFLLVLGVVAAICAALLVAFALSRGGVAAAPAASAGPAQDAKVTVLVARKALPAMTVIDDDCVNSIEVPKSKAAADSFASSVQVNGKLLVLPMAAGQPFTASYFAAEGSRAKFASTLANGKRAFAINITDHGALDGILYPGSIVDVLTSVKLQNGEAFSTTLLSAVEVLAIEKTTIVATDLQKKLDGEAPPPAAAAPNFMSGPVFNGGVATGASAISGHRVTLQVDARQAKALQVAMENGNLALALRNPLDSADTPGDPVTLSSALGLDRVTRGPSLTGLVADWFAKMSAAQVAAAPARIDPPAPTTKPSAPEWETTIFRGSVVETQHFAMPAAEAVSIDKGS